MSCECDDSSVVSQSSTFLSLLLPLSGGGRGGGQILRHDFCAFELTTMEGRGEEEEEEEGRRRESGANEERHYSAAVKTLVEYIYSSRLRLLRGRARSEAARGRQPTATVFCWFGGGEEVILASLCEYPNASRVL